MTYVGGLMIKMNPFLGPGRSCLLRDGGSERGPGGRTPRSRQLQGALGWRPLACLALDFAHLGDSPRSQSRQPLSLPGPRRRPLGYKSPLTCQELSLDLPAAASMCRAHMHMQNRVMPSS